MSESLPIHWSKSKEFQLLFKNFLELKSELGIWRSSPTFIYKLPNGELSLWKLLVHPHGMDEEDASYMSIHLKSLNDFTVNVLFTVSVLNDNNEKIIEKELTQHKFEGFGMNGCTVGWKKYEKRSFFSDEQSHALSSDGTLKLCCTMSTIDLQMSADRQILSSSKSERMHQLLDFSAKLFENGEMSDVTFVVGENRLNLHKNIVASASTVFHAMFTSKKTYSNEVKIDNAGFEVVTEMFRYIYKGEVYNIEGIANDLYILACEYEITGLAELCEKSLCSDLSADNAIRRLQFANEFGLQQLKQKAMMFINGKMREYS